MIPAWHVLALASGFLAFLALQSILYARERRDLYNRIMARDLGEYRSLAGRPPKGRNIVAASLKKYDGQSDE
jgi:hypothetical protein